MINMRKLVVIAGLSALLLTACEAAPNPYPNGPGFYENDIEATRIHITYLVPNGASRTRADDDILLKAADDTLARGHSWFRVTSRSADIDQRNSGTTVSLGTGTTSFGRNSSVGLGLGTSFNLGGGPRQVLGLEILMGDGAKPSDPGAYDAADVARTIRARR